MENGIKQEFTTPDTTQCNGVTRSERSRLIETCQQTAHIQAAALFPTGELLKMEALWAEARSWACDATNLTATGAKSEHKSLS